VQREAIEKALAELEQGMMLEPPANDKEREYHRTTHAIIGLARNAMIASMPESTLALRIKQAIEYTEGRRWLDDQATYIVQILRGNINRG